MISNRTVLSCACLVIALMTQGCGRGSDSYKLDAKPDVNYDELEKASQSEEDLTGIDTRALERK